MSFNGSGTYVPPAGQPVATGTVIQSATFNTLVTDIGNTFNNVLPRDGQAPMQGQLKITDGTSAIPGIGFNSEASSGMYRPVAGALALVASGVENLRINSAGRLLVGTTTDDGTNKLQVNGPTKITGALATTGAIAATGAITSSSTISATGAITAASYTGSNLVLQSAVPFVYFDENDQTGAAGYWRMVADSNGWRLDKNTATARDFSTYVTPFNVGTTGSASVNGAVPVQQGTGTGQGANTVKLGWGSSGGGLKCTVDVTDQGYIPFSTTIPNTGITFPAATTVTGGLFTANNSAQVNGTLTISNGTANGLTVNGSSVFNYGFANYGAYAQFTGGAAVTLANNGMVQIGNQTGLNIAMSDQIIQARNNGAVNNLYLNYHGGNVSTGGYTANNSNFICNGTVSATNGLSITGSAAMFLGGTALNFSNSGMKQIGSSAGNNVVYDYQSIQARANGSPTTLNLNPLGGTVYTWGAVQANANVESLSGSVVAQNMLYAKNPGTWMKVCFQDGASSVSGYVGADASNCFIAVDKNNSAYRFYVNQNGDATANGNVTAYSDERLKTNWREVVTGFVDQWAAVKHGIYDRTDTDSTQAGLSAQAVQAVLPEVVIKQEDGYLTLNYGAAAAVASVQLAKEVVTLRDKLAKMEALIKRFLDKVSLV